MKELHTELKELRIERGLTIEDIHRQTRIRISFLERIEEGDYSVAPELFIRAFLREYAEAIGIEPGRVMARLGGENIPLHGDIVYPDTSETEPVIGPTPAEENMEEIPSPQMTSDTSADVTHDQLDTPSSGDTSENTPEEPDTHTLVSSELMHTEKPDPPQLPLESPETEEPVSHRDPDIRATGGFFPEEEPKSPRALVFGFFFLIVVIAALAILYLNGIISF